MKDYTVTKLTMNTEQLERAARIGDAIDSIKADLEAFSADGMAAEDIRLANHSYIAMNKLGAWHGSLSLAMDKTFDNASAIIFRKNKLRGGGGGRGG